MRPTTILRLLATFISLLPATAASELASSSRNSLRLISSRNTGPDNVACQALTKKYDANHVYYKGTDVYNYENSPREFWSNTEILSPSCVFRPTSTDQIAGAVKILIKTNMKFAVRGGGHMGIKGANNIDDGVLVVMSNMTVLALSKADTVLSIGPSYRWVDVYSFLEPKGLVVSGGRLAPIGVPGLLLGGGISFYGNQYGFSCDNVINYEIVLADGSVQNANAKDNSDLFWALKGGSSNFGIVTRFDVQTFKSPKIWAGVYSVAEQYIPQFIAAIANYSASGINDPLSGLVPAVVSGSPNVAAAIIFYDSATISYPDCFKAFTDIPSIGNSLAFKTLTNFTEETGALVVPAVNDVFASGTMVGKTYQDLLKGISLINTTFFNEVPSLRAQIPAANITIIEIDWEPIGSLWLKASAARGGNALGLDSAKGTYVCYAQVVEWTGAQYNDAAYSWVASTAKKIDDALKAAGLYDPFHYMGDSAGFQIPGYYNGYGAANAAKLLSISKKYDPHRVFQNLMPGGFKIAA